MSLLLIGMAVVSAAVSGIFGLCWSRSSPWGERIAAGMMAASALFGLTGAGLRLGSEAGGEAFFWWPAAGNSLVGVDALSAFFLVPVFLMGGLGAVYGLGYWPQARHPGDGRKLRLFWGWLTAGMALLIISRHAMAFLFGWEVMALSAFFLVGTEDQREECREAGWVYFIATHIGTLALFALFALWRHASGSYFLRPLATEAVGFGVENALFFLALTVFCLKAGVMPLHFWLPTAHANAPTHVSAVLSGVVLKMGIYGLLRFLSLLPAPPSSWGWMILLLGGISGVLGVVFAIGQHDLKRLLAYHSVENIGIILLGMGVAMLGRSTGRPEWVVLGMAGCLLHVWNHALFKSLLFFSAGAVIHGTGTRKIDSLGGLARTMPWTAAMFLTGAVAICGLPPLNGFVSELLIYLGLFRSASAAGGVSAVLIAVPVLALIGALALACFVKVYGAVFLGSPRTRAAEEAGEPPASMKGPMGVLAVCCVAIGLAPGLVSPILDRAIADCLPDASSVSTVGALAPLGAVSGMAILLAALVGALTFAGWRRRVAIPSVVTWDCGYAAPTPRMQYTASSFAQRIVEMFRWALRPRVHRPSIHGLFAKPARMHSHVDDAVLDRMLIPAGRGMARGFAWFHRFQQGLTQHYVLYILVTLFLMLALLLPIHEILAPLFVR